MPDPERTYDKYIIEVLAEENIEKIIRSQEVSEDSLAYIAPELKLIRFVHTNLVDVPISDFPNHIRSEFEGASKNMAAHFKNLLQIEPPFNADDNRNRTMIARQIRDGSRSYLSFLPFSFMYIATGGWTEFITSLTNETKANANDSLALIKAARESAQIRAASSHASDFEQQAKKHFIASIVWLLVVFALACVTGVTALFIIALYFTDTAVSTTINASQLAAEILLFALLLYLLTTATKMYKMNVNQKLVNQTRANSLRTFEVFVTNADDADTKAAVLLQTTSTIFGPASTGLVNDPGDNQVPWPTALLMQALSNRQ